MATRQKRTCEEAFAFVRFHQGMGCFAPCTGQDNRALEAFAHLVSLWCASDANGQDCAEEAMRACLQAMHAKVWHLAKWMIPAIGDWAYTDRIWPRICNAPANTLLDLAGTEKGSHAR